MTREETQDFLAMVQAAYPNFNPPNKTAAVNAWYLVLNDYSWGTVQNAFAVYMSTNASGFAPAPGQIIEKIKMISEPQELNELEAWNLVSKALRNSTYNSEEEFSRLPPLVQKAVGSPGQLRLWSTDENFSEGVASSNFIKCYRMVAIRATEIAKIPANIRQLIESNQNQHMKLAGPAPQLIEQTEDTDSKMAELHSELPQNAIQKLKKLGYK